MDTDKEVRKAFHDLGLFWAKNPESTPNWREVLLINPKDKPHHVEVHVRQDSALCELERKPELLIASGVIDLISDVVFVELDEVT